MIGALIAPPPSIAIVLIIFATLIFAAVAAIVVAKVARDWRSRHDAPLRERLAGLPTAVALDEVAPSAPAAGRARRVARDMVIDATFALQGPSRARAIAWFESNGFVAETIEQMEHGRLPGLRPACALRLGRMGSPVAASVLAAGLRDHNYRVRDACAIALGRVATTTQVRDLVDAFARREVPRGVLSNALLQLRPDADQALVACLAEPDPSTRELVAQVLGLRRSAHAVTELMGLIDDPTPEVRRAALLALANVTATAAVDVDATPLLRLSHDDSPIVRSAAATSLGIILGDRAADVLSTMCRDADYWVSHRAAESLCRLPSGARFGWDVLRGHDDSPDGRQAKAACLEWMERTGGLESRIEDILQREDDAELLVTLAVLEEVGSRAWGDLFSQAPAGAGIPTGEVVTA